MAFPIEDSKMKEFVWKNITFLVRSRNGVWEYKDKEHLGGPWSEASKTLANKTYAASFRRKLSETINS